MTVQLTEEDMKEVRAAAYWRWAKDNPEEATACLGCGLVKPAQQPSVQKPLKPRRRSWRNHGGDQSKRSQAYTRRLRRLG
ncbi:hypothetical protein NWT09_24070 [Mycolicibacterium sp. jd]|uniref:hypothetical protein n=1 Tax=unclassified Mycolicibacterium TaxID=2636767 RepID=UPI00351B60DC